MKIRAALRYTLSILAVVPLTLIPVGAEAKPKAKKAAAAAPAKAKKSLALAPLEGKKNSEVRGWLRDALRSGFELTDAEDFKAKTDADYAKMGSDLGVDAVAVAKVEKTKLTVTVYRSSDARVLITLQFKAAPGPKLKSIIEKRLVQKLYGAFGIESSEKEEDDADSEEGADEAGEDSDADAEGGEDAEKSDADAEGESNEGDAPAADSGSGFAPTPFVLRAGLRLSQRSFVFKDTLSQLDGTRPVQHPLRDYNGGTDLALIVRGEVYPGALFGAEGLAANVGVIGSFAYGIPADSVYKPAGGTARTLTTDVREFTLGLRGRFPLSAKAGIGFSAVYGQQRYFLKGDETAALVPDILYSYARLGPDLWIEFGKVSVEAHVGARLVTGTGELEDAKLWFANVGARGIDAGLTLGFAVTPSISVLAGGEFTRYGFNFNPIPKNATYVAGGATDQYVGGWLGVGFHVPGKPASE